VCIPPSSPDLNSKDNPHRNSRVVGPDRFDADKDGIGCIPG
jgi:hypothetical protein